MSVRDLISETKRRMIARYPRFGGEVASANILFNSNLPYHTAATDGQDIYFDPAYFESLSEDDRVFLVAHEIMHIKFEHAFRLVSRDGKMKDLDTWNEATDAIINANLQRDGFAIKEGYVNRPEALNYSADEFYQILLKEKQQQAEQERQGQGQEGQQGQQGKSSQEQENQQGQEGQQGQEQQEGKESQEGQKAQQDEKEKQGQQGQEEGKQDQQGQSGQEKKDQEGQSGKSQQGNNGENGKQTTGKPQHHGDDHSLWQKAFQERMEEAQNGHKSAKNHKNDQENSQNESDENAESENPPEKDKNKSNFSDDLNGDNNKQNSNEDIFNAEDQDDDEYSFDEKKEFEQNREMRREIAKKYMDKLKNGEFLKTGEKIKLGNVGEAKSVIDWKLLLRREVEKTETIWSQRRSVAENNFAYRLDENDIDDEAETEVMIDVSGSVSLSMVKSFLRQLKPLLKQSKLKVGCFNEKFWGMTEIKTERDIDKFEIPNQARGNAAWTEDWDLAVRSFSKKREVNKIVFTDGLPQPGAMPKKDLKGTNVIWIVYENKNFSPCCGTVILVNRKEFNRPPQNMEKQREL